MRAALALPIMLVLAGCVGPAEPLPVEVGAKKLGFDSEGRGDPAPMPIGDCSAVLDDLNARVLGPAQARLDHDLELGRAYAYRPYHVEGWGAVTPPSAPPSAPAEDVAGAEVTGTNNQESGADEADLVKTDGEWTYVLSQGILHVLHSDHIGDISKVHSMRVGHADGQLLLERGDPGDPGDDRLLVLVPDADPRDASGQVDAFASSVSYFGSERLTRFLVLDLADRTAPVVLEERYIGGHVAGARLIDGVAHVVVTAWAPYLPLVQGLRIDDGVLEALEMNWTTYQDLEEAGRRPVLEETHAQATARNAALVANLTLVDHLPLVLLADGEGYAREPLTRKVCTRIVAPEDGTGRSVNTIWSIDMASLEERTIQVLGSSPIVYAAPGALVFAERSQDAWWYWQRQHVREATNLHWFDLDGLDVVHRASGRIAGTVQDPFSLDVHDGQLRVITTTGAWGRWWVADPEPMQNHLAVFRRAGGNLTETGAVSGFAPEERVWSARFTDTRAYVVTFRQIDPLWIIDLDGPPRILGELEIPGVSTYLHPLDDDRLLAMGIGARDSGQGLDWSRVQVSLFDTSDTSKPSRIQVLDLAEGTAWSWSGATREHKSFTYWDKLGLLAVPVSSATRTTHLEDGRNVTTNSLHMGLRLIQVDRDGLTIYGDVDQNHFLDGRWYWRQEIQRSHFFGFPEQWPERPVSVYAISRLGVTAHDLEGLHMQGSVSFGDA